MNERLEQIKVRVEKTTPGPWEWHDTGIMTEGGRDVLWFEWSSEYDPNGYTGVCEDDDVENMEFIENAREDIPWLLEQLEALQAAADLIPCAGCHRLYTHEERAVMLEKYGMFVCPCGWEDDTTMKRQYTLKERLEMRECE